MIILQEIKRFVLLWMMVSTGVFTGNFVLDIAAAPRSSLATSREECPAEYPVFDSDNATNCSGDPLDVFNSLFRDVENTVLDRTPGLTTDEEIVLGDSLHLLLQDSLVINDTGSQYESLAGIFKKLLPYRERLDLTYQIHYVESEDINAFAIAGGHIYVTSGLMSFVGSEDELAGIIGHEMGHVDKKHVLRYFNKANLARKVLGEWGNLAAQINAVLTAPFGQADEYESDKIGAYLAYMAGYDPRAIIDFFIRMKSSEQYHVLEKMMRTHPYSEQREICLEQYIQENLD